ncbi:MAG: 1-deoxy-D-xylulose-5-phosphate synthase [Deltaproteobacteria bacterium]|nr:1-deoxy-D-xylulose-5-phosphate synthase [Deltaproteobacteria bacterium]
MDEQFNKIQSPAELKALPLADLKKLSASIKSDIVQHTSVNGGHIGASLCCVDMIVAMHKVFETPSDSFVFDVGHQAYAHKMLTGRRFQFYKLRKENGISGFTNRSESEHDAFGAGHASTSISAALGILEGKKINGDSGFVVAVVGDGALTGGLTFEGLNHTGELKKNLIVILNDNRMSIDPNVGALKDSFEKEGGAENYFKQFDVDYWGPYDGHNILNMIDVLQMAKQHKRPVVIHLHTVKGHSYQPAEKDKIRFHGCGPFDAETGNAIKSPDAKQKYQDLFSETLTQMASDDDKILAITAAMPSGTSLKKFAKVHPDRFYDVGLAEPHAVEFAAGLAVNPGVKPFVCIYSTFLQRAYDQLIHDVALQNLPVRVCMDRAGFVGDDGATHQGLFDFAYLRSIPNFVVMAPKDEAELQNMVETARVYSNGPIALRFPRGQVLGVPLPQKPKALPIGRAEHLYGDLQGDVLVLAIGTPVHDAVKAAKELEHDEELSVSVINLRFAKPLDEQMICDFAKRFKAIVTVEEGVIAGGVGSAVLELLTQKKILKPVHMLGAQDVFVEHASQDRQREVAGVDVNGIKQAAIASLSDEIESNQGATVTKLPIKNAIR